jgi:hypothetical protein
MNLLLIKSTYWIESPRLASIHHDAKAEPSIQLRVVQSKRPWSIFNHGCKEKESIPFLKDTMSFYAPVKARVDPDL